MDLNYKEDLYIDEANLDVEYLEAGTLTAKYGEYLAQCRDKQKRADQNVKLIRSELIDKANRKPMRYLKLAKPTIDTVNAFYRNNKRHQQAKEELMDAEFELEMAQIAFDEIKGRKHAIRGLAELYAANYFAGPAVAIDLTEKRIERAKTRKEANNKVKLNKKPNKLKPKKTRNKRKRKV